MTLKIKTLLIAVLVGAANLSAQDYVYKKYQWDPNPKIHQLTAEEKEGNYIILKQKMIFDYGYESSGDLVMYETIHQIIHFNNEKGIEEMNKIYVPYGKILEEMDLKARTITPSGKIIPLNKSSVKKVDNLENSGPYLIFAMEGIEKGGEIEYIYTNKKSPSIYSYWKLQDDNIKKDVAVDFYSPVNLVFEAKSYNGFPEFKSDTTIKEKNHIYSSIEKINALNDEKYSAYQAERMRFDLQLTYNTARSKTRMYSWESAGVDFYATLFNFSKQELKSIDKLISKLGLEKLKTDEAKIAALELWVKTNIGQKETNEDLTVDKILDVKYSDNLNLQKLYIGTAQQLKIPVESVLSCERMKRKFDSSFPSYNNLQEYLVYYPSIGKYLSATDYSSRLGFPPPEIAGTKGLFIKETVLGDIKTGVSKIKNIDFTNHAASHNNISAHVEFTPETYVPVVNFKQDFVGYPAYYIQPAIPYMNEAQKEQFLEDMAKFPGKETIVKSVKMSGNTNSDVLVNPLVIESVVETPQLLENAGSKLLFKVGDLIGPQEELYQDKKRQLDGEIMYAHSFGRTLEIKIPNGYKLKNPDAIKIDKKYMVEGKPVSQFTSTYTLEGDLLKITVYEDYQVLFYPKDKYEEWRSVINASADFNKVVLILEKI